MRRRNDPVMSPCKRLDVAAAGAGVVKDAVEDAHGGGALQAANVGLGFV